MSMGKLLERLIQLVPVLLGPDGPLARSMPRYEPRAGQLQMARAVSDALQQGQILLCEAGTGTGKTLAYLVPAILSGKKVIISTASRALQDQIIKKDLPLIEKHLGLQPEVSVMKGLGNYLCLRRFAELRASPTPESPGFVTALQQLETLQKHFGDRCLTPIRVNTRLKEAPSVKQTIFELAPDSHGAEDYRKLVEHVLGETRVAPGHATVGASHADAAE